MIAKDAPMSLQTPVTRSRAVKTLEAVQSALARFLDAVAEARMRRARQELEWRGFDFSHPDDRASVLRSNPRGSS
jgi:hypothetical protein